MVKSTKTKTYDTETATVVKKVTIGANVAVIGKNAFKGCKKLASITVKKNCFRL